MHPLRVTLLYGGISALIVTLLGVWVSLLRLKTATYVGKEPPKQLVRPIRAHGNAAEWVPLSILMLALLELAGLASMPMHVLGGTLVATRLLHAYGVLGRSRVSMVAATSMYCWMAAASGWAIWLHFA